MIVVTMVGGRGRARPGRAGLGWGRAGRLFRSAPGRFDAMPWVTKQASFTPSPVRPVGNVPPSKKNDGDETWMWMSSERRWFLVIN